jgi:hypothetical protein
MCFNVAHTLYGAFRKPAGQSVIGSHKVVKSKRESQLLLGQSTGPVELVTFSMSPAYLGGQTIQKLFPLVLAH